MSKISVFNFKKRTVLNPNINIKTNDLEKFSIENENIIASFGNDGLLKSITLKSSGKQYPVSLKFVK